MLQGSLSLSLPLCYLRILLVRPSVNTLFSGVLTDQSLKNLISFKVITKGIWIDDSVEVEMHFDEIMNSHDSSSKIYETRRVSFSEGIGQRS